MVERLDQRLVLSLVYCLADLLDLKKVVKLALSLVELLVKRLV